MAKDRKMDKFFYISSLENNNKNRKEGKSLLLHICVHLTLGKVLTQPSLFN